MKIISVVVDIMEFVVSFSTLIVAIYQFKKIRNLKKTEKKLLLHSKFYFLESLLSMTIHRLNSIVESGNQISEFDMQELAEAYKLDKSVIALISEISELTYGCFDSIDKCLSKNIQTFFGCVYDAYNMINALYGILEKRDVTFLWEHRNDINEMSQLLATKFDWFRIEMNKHCVVK